MMRAQRCRSLAAPTQAATDRWCQFCESVQPATTLAGIPKMGLGIPGSCLLHADSPINLRLRVPAIVLCWHPQSPVVWLRPILSHGDEPGARVEPLHCVLRLLCEKPSAGAVDDGVIADAHGGGQVQIFRRGADVEIDLARFDAPLHLSVEESELGDIEAERDESALARIEVDAAETSELQHGTRHRGISVGEIELDDVRARLLAGVGHRQGDLYRVFSVHVAVRQGELGVRE